jgi:site-specific recombinase XerD
LWSGAAPTTWNRNRAAVGSWLSRCTAKTKWTAPALPGTCERRKEPEDKTRAVDQALIDRICTRRGIPLRERVLWRMLYETASRAEAVLQLNVEDCDFGNRRAKVVVKGGDTEWIVWAGEPPCCPATSRDTSPGRCSAPTAAPGRPAARPRRAGTSAREPTGCASGTTAPAF